MGKEIERKFLVKDSSYRQLCHSKSEIMQGYLCRTNPDEGTLATVRVRIRDNKAFITVKSPNTGCIRSEWEYEIPVADARDMLTTLAGENILNKTRYLFDHHGFTWEIDEFHGNLNGLVIAEIELPDESTSFDKPSFIGEEVTDNPHYYNSNLCAKSTKVGGTIPSSDVN